MTIKPFFQMQQLPDTVSKRTLPPSLEPGSPVILTEDGHPTDSMKEFFKAGPGHVESSVRNCIVYRDPGTRHTWEADVERARVVNADGRVRNFYARQLQVVPAAASFHETLATMPGVGDLATLSEDAQEVLGPATREEFANGPGRVVRVDGTLADVEFPGAQKPRVMALEWLVREPHSNR